MQMFQGHRILVTRMLGPSNVPWLPGMAWPKHQGTGLLGPLREPRLAICSSPSVWSSSATYLRTWGNLCLLSNEVLFLIVIVDDFDSRVALAVKLIHGKIIVDIK